MDERLSLLWIRVQDIRWRRVALGAALAFLVVMAVPPFRRTASAAASRVILTAVSPFAPSIRGFDALPQASKVLAADGTELGRLGPEDHHPVALRRLPPHVVHAVLAAEDANFYQHGGVDLTAIGRAMWNDVRGRKVQGGSTITEQLAKLNYTGSEHTVFRKFRELLYASKLEQRYSKDELLERYVNQAYFGAGNYGIAAASAHYFGVGPEQLDTQQAAALAGMIHAPGYLDPYRHPHAVTVRRNQVLATMEKHGWLASDERHHLEAVPIGAVPEKPIDTGSGQAPHFVQFVAREAATVDALGGAPESRAKQAYTGGYTFETTLDTKAFAAATDAVRQTLGAPGDPTTAVVSVQPGDGAVRVLFGGLDPNLHFDVASQGRRQPGSSFKPYVYLATLEAGIDPRSILDSGSPKTVSCGGAPWTVKNYEGKGTGPMTVEEAMVHSVNTVFEQVMADVGPAATQRMAERLGIDHQELTPARCAMALGGLPQGVSPLEQAAAFAAFAAKGMYAQPYSIVRIKDRAGRVIYEHSTKTSPAVPQLEAGVLNAALEGVVDGGTGSAASIGRPLAGKTGTTENDADAWFIGYVPQLATAVWVGHPDALVPMTDVHGIAVTGGTFPARIFGRYMRTALTGVAEQDIYTASPDQLSLHLLNDVSAAPTTSTSTSSTTSSSVPAAPPPSDQPQSPDQQPPEPPAQPAPTSPPYQQPTTTSPRPKSTTTTVRTQQQASSQTTLGP